MKNGKRVKRIIGDLARRRGEESEGNAIKALETYEDELPDWVEHVRPATHSEDRRGVDLVFETDLGDVYLQLKSSKASAKEASRDLKYEGIPVAVCAPGEPYDRIFKRLVGKATARYNQLRSVDKSLQTLAEPAVLSDLQLHELVDMSVKELKRRAL